MNCEEVLAILSASLDAEAGTEELAAARAHLAGCESCRTEFARIRGAEELLTTERERRRHWGSGPRRARRLLGRTALAAAAALLLAAAGFLWLGAGSDGPLVGAVRGEAFLGERPVRVGAPVASGDRLIARGRSSALRVEYGDGTVLTLRGDSELVCMEPRTGRRGFRLAKGRLTAEVVPGSGGMKIVTAAGEVTVLGTVFEVEARGSGPSGAVMRVFVARGAVRVSAAADGGESRVVAAGVSAEVAPGRGRPFTCRSLEEKEWRRLLGSVPEHADPRLAAAKIPPGVWVPRAQGGAGRKPGRRCYLRMVHCAALGGGVLFGGEGDGADNALWCYNATADRWREVCPARKVANHAEAALFPERRNGHVIAAVPGRGLRLVGGNGRFGPAVVWRYSIAEGKWVSAVKSDYWPLYAANCWAPGADRLFVLGTEGNVPPRGFCSLDPATGRWEKPASEPMPRARTRLDNYMCWDSKRRRIILQRFRHRRDPEGLPVRTWSYDPAKNAWIDLAPPAQPTARDHGALDYSPRADAVLLFGGGGANCETWVYRPAGNRWEQLFPANNPPPRTRHALYYDPSADLFVVYGGSGDRGYLGDVWVFRLAPAE